MSSSCNEFNELLLDLAYDELDTDTSDRLLKHRDGCDACQSAYNQLMGVRTVAQKIAPPEIPSHFDADILALARQTAASFAADQGSVATTPSTVPVAAAPSFAEKLMAFIFRPAVLGTGLAAAAVLIAVTSIKSGSHTTMMDAPDGAPFVGAAPTIEEEKLPDASASETSERDDNDDADDSADDSNFTKEKSSAKDDMPAPPQRVQKAGTAYEPLYSKQSTKKKSARVSPKGKASASGNVADIASDDLAAGPNVKKNPADLLKNEEKRESPPSRSVSKSSETMPTPAVSQSAPAAATKKQRRKSAARPAKKPQAQSAESVAASAPSADADMASDYEEAAEPPEQDARASRFELGLAAYNSGDCTSAISHFSSFLDSSSKSGGSIPVATHYLAKCEKRTGRCGKALIHYEQLLNGYHTYNQRSNALYEAAQCHQRLGHTARAKVLLEELSLDPAWRKKAQQLMKKL